MRYMVIGLGSMGKRRVRNLLALGVKSREIAGFDIKEERLEETKKYGIELFKNFEIGVKEHKPNIFIISTPPHLHMEYAYYGVERAIHCFIEASVVDSDKILKLSKYIEDKDIIVAPSCTMKFYPAPKKIKELIESRKIGKVLNFNYQTGQYLPDWHPWEDIKDFYVSNPDTGGAREIVPFELTWLNDIFGNPNALTCVRRKLTNMPIDIEDIYHFVLEYPDNILGNITIEVISNPKVTRELRVLGSRGEITFSADCNCVKYINRDMRDWEIINLGDGTVERGYINPEEPYIEEIRAFIKAVESLDLSKYPNSLKNDYRVLQVLYKLEEISNGKNDLSR